MTPERALLISAGSFFILINLTLFAVVAIIMAPPPPAANPALADNKLFVPLR
jgi:hypothetical protein